ncbi:DISARM system phospholipase D-like protein DrmC [Prauserella alba]|uniref:phospholipase D n=1 Tax=Prauserella alba TaxID=176898 RepID=A0ABP4FP21_9PSEU|nr:DISARM system phospholipase D-like protein DrmC [Prauserella alba]MCP2178875.1 PLD-like domain-containing protein [Prauserella alba]
MSTFETTATAAAPHLGAAALRGLATRIGAGWPAHAVLAELGYAAGEYARPILRVREYEGVPAAQAAAFLRGLAAGYAEQSSSVSVETVWSGPSTHSVPVRATAQALIQVVNEATAELLLMTYSGRRHEPLREALSAAVERGVEITVVVETLQGAGSALAGQEPAAAFAGISGVRLWHWPVARRTEPRSKLHAKLAVADRRVLLVSSANLTQSGVEKNIEAGTLVRGGSAPPRTAEHILELRNRGVLQPLAVGAQGAS